MKNLTEMDIAGCLKLAYQEGVIAASDEVPGWINEDNLHCAAVLIPLAWYQGEWHVILTRRSDKVDTHPGQVSFPGGGCNREDSSAEATALREAEEEIGLSPGHVRLLGRLNDVVTITHYRVTPIVGVVPWPYQVKPAPDEVARVFTIPLGWLADRGNCRETPFTPGGSERPVPIIIYDPYDEEILWGISGRMIRQLLEVLGL